MLPVETELSDNILFPFQQNLQTPLLNYHNHRDIVDSHLIKTRKNLLTNNTVTKVEALYSLCRSSRSICKYNKCQFQTSLARIEFMAKIFFVVILYCLSFSFCSQHNKHPKLRVITSINSEILRTILMKFDLLVDVVLLINFACFCIYLFSII